MACKGGCGGGGVSLKLFASASHEAVEAMASNTYAVPLFGTLLGLERGGDLIDRDYDIDFYSVDGIDVVPPGMVKSYEETIGGLKTQEAFQWAERKRLFIDLFRPIADGDEYVVRIVHRRKPAGSTTYRFPKPWLDEVEFVEYDWVSLVMPVHRIEILQAVYGNGWRKRDSKWNHRRD